jgi:hypothetical protein
MKRPFLVTAGILIALTLLPLAQVASAGPTEPQVPGDIEVGAGHKLFLVGHAVGVQIHTCTFSSGSYGWSFVGPRANLYDDSGKLLTTHFGGPSWQARDGSLAVGQVEKRVTVDSTAIPWLLLKATSSVGPDGDRLAGTTYIQRIATAGGLAPPAAACDASMVGTTQEVPYTADYTFWKEIGA